MSDTLQVPPAEDLTIGQEAAGSNHSRLLIGLAVGAGALVIGGAGYFLFLSGGTDAALGPVATGPVIVATPDQTHKNSKKAPNDVNTKFEVGRDPFAPLAAEALLAKPPIDNPGATTGSQPAPAGNAAPSQPATGGGSTQASYTLTLKSVNAKAGSAVFDIDGKAYTVKEGAVFPSTTTGPFKLVSVDAAKGGSAKVLFGSELPVVVKKGDPTQFQLN